MGPIFPGCFGGRRTLFERVLNGVYRCGCRVSEARGRFGKREFFLLDLGAMGAEKCLFELRRSTRAKRLRLIIGSSGLTVVAPADLTSLQDIIPLLEPHKEWIRKKLEQVKLAGCLREPGRVDSVPEKIFLKGLEEEWRVALSDRSARRLLAHDGVVLLPRDFTRGEALAALRKWVLLRARSVLPCLLAELVVEHGLGPKRVAVKEMKSRWGSCSAKGNINLNARLLFLPPGLMRHVLMHELCHLKEMNHSQAFYACLRNMDPETDRHVAELREAWRMVPLWAYH